MSGKLYRRHKMNIVLIPRRNSYQTQVEDVLLLDIDQLSSMN